MKKNMFMYSLVLLLSVNYAAAQGNVQITFNTNPSNVLIELLEIAVIPGVDKLKFLRLFFYDSGITDGNAGVLLYDGTLSNPRFLGGRVSVENINGREVQKCLLSFPPWVIGQNKVKVVATFSRLNGTSYDILKENSIEFSGIANARSLFKNANGIFFHQNNIPIFTGFDQHSFGQDNSYNLIKDADKDGLSDAWENIALSLIKPILAFDADEDLFKSKNAGHTATIFSRIFAINSSRFPGKKYILFRNVIAFNKDYGDPLAGCGDHPGDTENFNTYWEVIDDFTIRLAFMESKGHVGHLPAKNPEPTMFSYLPSEGDFNNDGVEKLYIEEDKHGIWCSKGKHDIHDGTYDIGGTREFRPKAFNVGEPYYRNKSLNTGGQEGAGTGRHFLDSLTITGEPLRGPYKEAFNLYNNETIWKSKPFCGGLGFNPDDEQSILCGGGPKRCAGDIGGFLSQLVSTINYPDGVLILKVDFRVIPDNDPRMIELKRVEVNTLTPVRKKPVKKMGYK